MGKITHSNPVVRARRKVPIGEFFFYDGRNADALCRWLAGHGVSASIMYPANKPESPVIVKPGNFWLELTGEYADGAYFTTAGSSIPPEKFVEDYGIVS